MDRAWIVVAAVVGAAVLSAVVWALAKCYADRRHEDRS